MRTLATVPAVVTLPSGANVAQTSVSPECQGQLEAWNAGTGPGLSATCLTSFANADNMETLING